MKIIKKYILMILTLTILIITGCETKETTTPISYDKSTPTSLELEYTGSPNYLKISNSNYLKEYTDTSSFVNNNKLVFDKDFFMNLYQGEYEIEISDSNNTKKYLLTVTNYNKNFESIDVEEIFTKDEEFYVLFSKDSCPACENLKPKAIEFNDFLISYNSCYTKKLYYVDTSTAPAGSVPEVTSSPTLLHIKDKKIEQAYVGVIEITEYINETIDYIKNIKVINSLIENPKETTVNVDFIPTKYTISGNGVDKTYDAKSRYDETSKSIIFASGYWNMYLPGLYSLRIYNDTNSIDVMVHVYGTFDYINKEQIFQIDEEKYYVFIYRDGCTYCGKVKPFLLDYVTYSKKNNTAPIYAINYAASTNVTLGKDTDNTVGLTSSEELTITGFPRVLVIENGVITEGLKTSAIISLFTELQK